MVKFATMDGLRGCYSDPYSNYTIHDTEGRDKIHAILVDAVCKAFDCDTERAIELMLEDAIDGVDMDAVVRDAEQYIKSEGGYRMSYLPLCIASKDGWGVFVDNSPEEPEEGEDEGALG